MVAKAVWVTEEPPNQENPEIVALRKDIEKLQTKLEGDIRELRTGTERDIQNLKQLVSWVLAPLVIALVAGIIVAVLRIAGLI